MSFDLARFRTEDHERNVEASARIADLINLVTEIRRFRAQQGIPPGRWVPARLPGFAGSRLADLEKYVRALAKLSVPGEQRLPGR